MCIYKEFIKLTPFNIPYEIKLKCYSLLKNCLAKKYYIATRFMMFSFKGFK